MRLIESIYLQRMRSTSDIQFFVCRSRIIPEPPFPSQGIAGSGNEIGRVQTQNKEFKIPLYCHIFLEHDFFK